ncbi:MAG: DNA translocase FtsK [Candidatus Pacebacteria bacterium]|nr:DNA translocase FtsK [Candidatus Paceibacterota bacterium]
MVIRWTLSLALIALGLILALGAAGFAGSAGGAAYGFTYATLGVEALLLPIIVVACGVAILLKSILVSPRTAVGVLFILAAVLVFLGTVSNVLGGDVGHWAGIELSHLFGLPGAIVLLIAAVLIGLALATDIVALYEMLRVGGTQAALSLASVRMPTIKRDTSLPDMEESGEIEAPPLDEPTEELPAVPAIDPAHEPTVKVFNHPDNAPAPADGLSIPYFDAEYSAPPLSILGEDKGKPGVGDIKANANIIRRTFQNFGISVEMDEVSVGPTVTRYAIKPAEGVRLSKIVSLQNNLELALAAHPVRIEAPIPGKSLVGIEVPNASKAMVGLGGVIGAPEWKSSTKPLLAALGRDISGTPHYVNVAKMPHGLIAGATGSGKSVAIHAVITSLLYRNGPNQLRFIMVDPKRVELTLYNGIPHLLTPVITDPKKSILALKWAAKEMDRRYNILEGEQVRDIDSYHRTIVEPAKKRKNQDSLPEAMPYIVIVIDELADIMQTYPRELEAAIVRLAQMSRAVGIHLVLSTQRPSVNVITGLIKANVPTRMALQVASQIDSRTILDGGGAESLLGAGDMLYLSADMQKPVRIQTAYISENEVKKVVQYIKQHNAGSLNALDLGANTNGTGVHEANDAVMLAGDDEDVDDDLYGQAKEAVEEAGRASTSYLQRKLRIGYSRAARLMDLLEEKGIIGPADGSRPRDVLSRAGGAQPAEAETADTF